MENEAKKAPTPKPEEPPQPKKKTKAKEFEEVKANTEQVMQVIKNEMSTQSESLQERLKKRKAELAAKKAL